LTGLGLLLPGRGSTIAQKLEMNLYFLNRFFEINGHMRVPKEFPKDYPKEMQGLYEFVAEMRHMILINRLPPMELGDSKLIATGFEEWSKPLEGFPNAPTHKWTDEEDRLLLNAQLAIGNDDHHLQGHTPFDVSNHWRQLIGIPKFLSNSQRQRSGLTTLSKWMEDEDRILLNSQLAIGNEWKQITTENFSHWTFLSKQVAVYVYKKNIDGGHKIFNDNTKKFLLDRDDIKQCLTALRTQSVLKEILDAVNVLMSNAKKRPPSSEFGNTMNSNPSNDDTAHQILCGLCSPKKKVRKCDGPQ